MLHSEYVMKHIFKSGTKKIRITGIRLHDLKSACASLLIATGAPISTVSGILRYRSRKKNLHLYSYSH